MKLAARLALVSALLLAGCSAAGDGGQASSSAAEEPDAQARVVTVAAADWSFTPASIAAKKGEKVILRVQGVEGRHGFAVPELGINTVVAPGKTVDIELPTDASGEFAFRCSVPCGEGHRDMTGTIVISD